MSLTSDILHKLRRAYRNKQGTHFTADELRHLASLGVLHVLFKAEADEIVADLGFNVSEVSDEAADTVPPVYSVKTLAHRWRCSESTVRKLISQGDLHYFRHGNMVRIPVDAVTNFERHQADNLGGTDPGTAARRTAAELKRMPRR